MNPAMKVEIKLEVAETAFMPGNGDLRPDIKVNIKQEDCV